jgi:TonB family protein
VGRPNARFIRRNSTPDSLPGRIVLLVAGIAFLLLAVPDSTAAQLLVAPPARVAWPLIDFIVIGDSTHGVQLLASPNLHSTQGRDQFHSASITLEPAPTRLWAAGVARVVDSIDKQPPRKRTPFVTLALVGNRGRAWLRLTLGPEPTSATPFDLEILDSTGLENPTEAVAWSAPASAANVLILLTTLDAEAQHSALDSTVEADSTAAYLVTQLDRSPELTRNPNVPYPPAAYKSKREGRVWVEFVLTTSGTVRPETVRLLMSDGEEFSQAVLEVLPTIQYTPGMRHGTPVRTLMRAPFIFTIVPDRVRRVRLPFVIRVP